MYFILAMTDGGPYFITKINRAMTRNDEGVMMKLPSKITIDCDRMPLEVKSRREAEYICDAIYQNLREFPFINDVYVVTAPNKIQKQPEQLSYRGTPFRFTVERCFTCPLKVPEGFSWDRDYFKGVDED